LADDVGAMKEPAPSQQRSGGTRPRAIEVVAYDPGWPGRFAELGRELRAGLGEVALRIDHIGSTAVPGLAAKPIIDIQVSVAAFEPLEAFRVPLERLGYVYRADNPERTKRYFREPPGRRRTHVHVRRAGSFSEQWRCCSVTTCAPILRRRPSMRRRSELWPSASGTTGTPTRG
jgi:GrpB-like predicted nucleotidyltransferase (UPF0157 family)